MKLFDGALNSQYMFEEVCDLDLSSLYPSIILAFNLAPETFIKKINVRTVDPYTQEEINVEDVLIDDYISRDYVFLGNKYFNLPNMSQLIKKVKEEELSAK